MPSDSPTRSAGRLQPGATERSRQLDSGGPVGVRGGGGVDRVDVGLGVVVAEDRVGPAGAGRQVVAVRAEVARSGGRPRRRGRWGRRRRRRRRRAPQVSQVDGMNCSGPTAWSQLGSPCQRRDSAVAGIAATCPCRRARGRASGSTEWPSSPSVRPPMVPCWDSTQPMPASVVQPTWQPRRLGELARWRRRVRRAPGCRPAPPSSPPRPGRPRSAPTGGVRLGRQRGVGPRRPRRTAAAASPPAAAGASDGLRSGVAQARDDHQRGGERRDQAASRHPPRLIRSGRARSRWCAGPAGSGTWHRYPRARR